jgi:PKD-like family
MTHFIYHNHPDMKKYILLPLLLLGLMACYKDKGNYNYLPLKNIQIDSLGNLQRLYMDSLVINPVVQVDKGTENDLEFQWSMYPTTQSMEQLPAQPDIIGHTKVLRIQINKAVRQYPYVVTLRVSDKATGVSTYRNFQLMINSLYSKGWLVLNDKNGVSDVDIITPADTVLRNIYRQVNGAPVPGKARHLRLLPAYSGTDELYIETAADLLQVRNPEFSLLRNATAMFYAMPATLQPQFMTINDYATQRYLVSDGKVFVASTLNNGKYGLPVIGDYVAAPFITAGGASCFYDQKNGRFLRLPELSNAVTVEPYTELKPDQAFDVNNVKGTLLYMEKGPDLAYHFFRLTDGALHLYGLNTYSNDFPGGLSQPVTSPEMQHATAFSTSEVLPLVYFAAGNSLYVYDVAANSAKKLFDFPAGVAVPVIKMLKDWQSDDDNAFLAVGTNSGVNGTVYYFKLAGTGELVGGTYHKKFDGFGQISDIIYKSK